MKYNRTTKAPPKTAVAVHIDGSQLEMHEVPLYLRCLDDAEFYGGWVAVLMDVAAQGGVGLKPLNDALVAVREEYKRRGGR